MLEGEKCYGRKAGRLRDQERGGWGGPKLHFLWVWEEEEPRDTWGKSGPDWEQPKQRRSMSRSKGAWREGTREAPDQARRALVAPEGLRPSCG